MLRPGRREARLVEAALLMMAAEGVSLVRRRASAAALAQLGAGAALAVALRSALLGGRPGTRLVCLTAALGCHLVQRRRSGDRDRAP